MNVALASLDPVWEDRAHNLRTCRELVSAAAARGAHLVAFPEMTLTGFTMNAASISEPGDDSPSIHAFS